MCLLQFNDGFNSVNNAVNIAYVVICNKAVKVFQGDGGEYRQFIDVLDSKF